MPKPQPPAQTPVLFLKGGAAGMFSAECVALLAKYGYKPDDFGDYDHVYGRCKAAREKKPADRTDHEKFLAGCQSGHLQQNACSQRQRGNPCTNLVDGHDDNRYPCMPHQGRADTAGTEHNWVSQDENDAPLRPGGRQQEERGLPADGRPAAASSVYPQGAMDADADQRTQEMLKRRQAQQATSTASDAGMGAGGTGAVGGSKSAASAAGTSGAQAKDTSKPWEQEITGKTAAECINNFRKAGVAAMKQRCIDNMEENRRIANGGGTPADGRAMRARLRRERNQARNDRDAARQERDTQQQNAAQKQQELGAAEQDAAQNPNDAAVHQRLAQARDDHAAASTSAAEANSRCDDVESRYNSAASRYGRVRNAMCRYQQGRRLLTGEGRDDGRIPPRNTLVDTGPQTGSGGADQTGEW